MNYLITNQGIVMYLDKPVKVSKQSPAYAEIINALSLPAGEQEAAIKQIIKQENPNSNIEEKGFVVKGENVFYKNEQLPRPLARKIISLIQQNLPVEIFKKFWENLQLNPSRTSVNELYDFLEYKELPITDDGCFIAYRGLKSDFYSKNGNLETKVLQGKVNEVGQIYNGVGERIEIARNSCDDKRENNCSAGLHVSSHSYAKGWSEGKLVAVKVNPKDVVSVPTDYNCQKLRCCAYEVIAEIQDEIEIAAVDNNLQPVVKKQFVKSNEDRARLVNRIKSYLESKRKAGVQMVTIKAIQSIFSPECPSTIAICDAVTEAGFVWKDYQGKKLVFLS